MRSLDLIFGSLKPDLGTESWGFMLLLVNPPPTRSWRPAPLQRNQTTLALERLGLTLFLLFWCRFSFFCILLGHLVEIVLDSLGAEVDSSFANILPRKIQRRYERQSSPPYNGPIYQGLFYYSCLWKFSKALSDSEFPLNHTSTRKNNQSRSQ